jgi:cation diffusion facilitator family transporter
MSFIGGGLKMDENLKEIKRVLWVVLLLNIMVALAKVILGSFVKSSSILADGFHSMADGSSNIIGLVGIAIAMRPVDKDHPYGHKKFETFAALGIAGLLALAIAGILHEAYERIVTPVIPKVNGLSFVVMLITLGINLWVVNYENKKGNTLQSDILVSDAYHTRSDIYVSLSVIVTLIAVKFGMIWVDTLASLVIAILIGIAAWEIIQHSSTVLCDKAMLDEEHVVDLAMQVNGVKGCHKVRSRGRQDDLKVDLHIQVDPMTVVQDAHLISHEVAAAVCRQIQGVSDVVVHVEPLGDVEG